MDINNLFIYHPPSMDQVPHYEAIRIAAKIFATVIVDHTPTGIDQQVAVRHVRDAVMTANASIALNGEL